MRRMEIAGGGVPVLIRRAPENNGEGESGGRAQIEQHIYCRDKL